MTKSPLAIVKERFGDKQKLVEALKKLASDDLFLDRVNAEKGLDLVSNRKLIHLHDLLEQVKKDHGSRAGLIKAVAAAEGHSDDANFVAALERFPTPRLVDRLRSAQKRAN
jgi:hypothetical protein